MIFSIIVMQEGKTAWDVASKPEIKKLLKTTAFSAVARVLGFGQRPVTQKQAPVLSNAAAAPASVTNTKRKKFLRTETLAAIISAVYCMYTVFVTYTTKCEVIPIYFLLAVAAPDRIASLASPSTKETAAKDDGLLSSFISQFTTSLATEYRFVDDLAHGLAECRPDAVLRHLNLLFSAANLFGAKSAALFGSEIVSFITGQLEKNLHNEQNTRTEKNFLSLSKYAPDKKTFLFQQISNEVVYRYGACIYQFIEFVGADNAKVALDRLALTGAIRIIFFALKRNIGFEHCEMLVRGEFV
jgi:predicted secreted protein